MRVPSTRTNRMRLLLIGPTALDSEGRPIRQRRLYLPGLTLPMLAAVTPAEVDLTLCFETTERIPYDERWDLVGLTGMGSGIVRAWQIADEFRRRGVPVVIGGIAASLARPGWTLQHADALVTGESEEVWPTVLADFGRGALRQVYRIDTPPPIDALPEPRYDLFDGHRLGPWRPVQATRGCPFTCSFCSITSFFHQRYRKRPVDQVVRDIRLARRHGTHYIAFIDDNIGVDWDYSAALWEALVPERVIWISQCSLHIADRPEMLRLAYRSGCRLLSVGIESTSLESLDDIDKAWNRPGRYREAVRAIRDAGIDVSTEMIVGLDGDDASVFQHTYDFIVANEISVPRVHILTPIPGTPLYETLEREGRLLGTDFSRFTGGHAVYRPRRLDPVQLEQGYWELSRRLYAWPAMLRRLARNHAGLGVFMRAFVIGTNLHYRRHVHHRITPGIV